MSSPDSSGLSPLPIEDVAVSVSVVLKAEDLADARIWRDADGDPVVQIGRSLILQAAECEDIIGLLRRLADAMEAAT